jgi:uncharacterized protein with HEPN domain
VKDDRIYLRHVLECIAAIALHTAGGENIFLTDRKTQKATIRELQELAESTNRLSQRLKVRHPEIPWREIAGFRNVLVHDYLGLDARRVWNIIRNDLPPLRIAMETLLRQLPEEA